MLRVKKPHLVVFWHLILMNLSEISGAEPWICCHSLGNVNFNENLLIQLQLFWRHPTASGNTFKSKFEVPAPADNHVNSWDRCLCGKWEPNLWFRTDVAYTEAGSVLRSRMNRNQRISCKKVGIRYWWSSVRPRSQITKIAIACNLGNSVSQVD